VSFLRKGLLAAVLAAAAILPAACGHDSAPSGASVVAAPASSAQQPAISPSDAAPPAAQTGGFDGAAAYDFTAKLVAFGPRPSGSDAIRATQDYLIGQLKSFGCAVDTDDFHAATPVGSLPMKNIIAKIPGEGQGIILLLTHYDTKRLDNFVGAEDGGSSTGLMLEMARLLCSGPKRKYAVWMAFVDGEEAVVNWDTDNDNTYGSRELAARLALSGDLKRVHAVILADMIGQKNLEIPREDNSTKWLTNLVWSTAARLGYQDIFVSRENSVSDDHQSFLARNVPAVDIIDLDGYQAYWHTPQDTLDKISPRNLAIVGHVLLESLNELQR
jgi:glutaminyl-peptide cyclotransferase